jgi:hypothetical protein
MAQNIRQYAFSRANNFQEGKLFQEVLFVGFKKKVG